MKKFDYIVYIGRFQPLHEAHLRTVQKALSLAEKVIVLIGSANQPRTIKNPFTWEERRDMFTACINVMCVPHTRIAFRGIEDAAYNNQQWARDVQSEVDGIIHLDEWGCDNTPQGKKIGIIGHKKDGSSFYLSMFPQWDFVEMENISGINATDIRNAYFGHPGPEFMDSSINVWKSVPRDVYMWLLAFIRTHNKEYTALVEEYDFIKKYKESWAAAPYPPTFVTADAVVVQSGHVLMVRRGACPGENLLALPGGFVNQNETIEDAMIRELREETKLKVPEPVIRGSIKASKVFDDPSRSLRGRTITQAFLVELASGELPKVKGGDDAKKALWIPLSELQKMKNQIFEDHAAIIHYFLGRV